MTEVSDRLANDEVDDDEAGPPAGQHEVRVGSVRLSYVVVLMAIAFAGGLLAGGSSGPAPVPLPPSQGQVGDGVVGDAPALDQGQLRGGLPSGHPPVGGTPSASPASVSPAPTGPATSPTPAK